jgi:hypothetical protein
MRLEIFDKFTPRLTNRTSSGLATRLCPFGQT